MKRQWQSISLGLFTVAVLQATAWQFLAAQQRPDSASGSIVGIAFDSLRGRPLVGAMIAVEPLGPADSNRVAITDDSGRFEIAGLHGGDYRAVLLHPLLDSLGLASPSARVTVEPGRSAQPITLAVPSFARFAQLICGRVPLADSGIVFGTISGATRSASVADARIALRWDDISFDKTSGIASKNWKMEATSNAGGDYAACGLPIDTPLRISATKDSLSAGTITVILGADRLVRRDLTLGSLETGIVEGIVRSTTGTPIEQARVSFESQRETRSDTAGRFKFAGLPTGTRELMVSAVGAKPTTVIVDVAAQRTTNVVIELERMATLDTVNVTATSAWRANILSEIAGRRRLGFGKFMDSTQVAHYGMLSQAISMLSTEDFCAMYLDGMSVGLADLRIKDPRDVALVEVLLPFEAPDRFRGLRGDCTKPILLIWTRNVVY